jgi:hypothetical protein
MAICLIVCYCRGKGKTKDIAVLIDTLKAAEIMEAAGFTEKQAKAVIEAFVPAGDELVTKSDLTHGLTSLRQEMANLEQRLTTRIYYAAQVATVIALIGILSFFGRI